MIGQANSVAQFQMYMSDYQQAQTIQTQIGADAQKQQMERWKILQDTRPRSSRSNRTSGPTRQDPGQDFNKWDEYIRS